jgi:glycosyltransferase involved in cell wall biosynthesis
MRLAIVHYHLRKGGVTRVIASALEALGDSVEQAIVISSTPSEEPLPCRVVVIPELAYTTEASTEQVEALHARLVHEAQAHLGGKPDLWHIHNHSLGKNVNFPEVVRRLLSDGARMLLQIHDFAEDGRPGNYKAQKRPYADGVFESYDDALYPVAPQIGYAVLNGRDRNVIKQAGVPEDRVFWLPNAVSVPAFPPDNEPARLSSEKPLILYPTRAIRRKNLGELLLLAKAYPDFHYATTLSPKNPEWEDIHRSWIDLGRRLHLPVSFALGEQPGQSFEALVRDAEMMVTTSVGEGFGLAFLEPWLFDKPVMGRDLPEITMDFTDNGIVLPDLYPEWRVPCEGFDISAQAERFLESAHSVYKAYDQSCPESELRSAWNELVNDGKADFGTLDEIAQAEVLEFADSSRIQDWMPTVDPGRIERAVVDSNRSRIADLYGLSKYGDSLRKIYTTLMDSPASNPTTADSSSVLRAFLDPKRIRLLRT